MKPLQVWSEDLQSFPTFWNGAMIAIQASEDGQRC